MDVIERWRLPMGGSRFYSVAFLHPAAAPPESARMQFMNLLRFQLNLMASPWLIGSGTLLQCEVRP
jgi:hypothetical protein